MPTAPVSVNIYIGEISTEQTTEIFDQIRNIGSNFSMTVGDPITEEADLPKVPFGQPMQFEHKPVIVDAMWFMGGAECATHIIDWVMKDPDASASWMEAHPAWEHENGSEGYAASNEKITIQDSTGNLFRAEPGDWVYKLEGQPEVFCCSADDFAKNFNQLTYPEASND